MGRKKIYLTPEARAEAKRAWNRKYAESERGRTRRAEQIATPEAQALAHERYVRYRQTDKYQASQARYAATAKGKATQNAYQATQRLQRPERIAARAAVYALVRKGIIERPPICQKCGMPKPDAHHFLGYAPEHWLSIEWLCRKCHKAAHR